ncbi:MAG: TIGR03620 family F420-dependent LLM class oxidoreductase [Caulobacteraceae bacterium]|nr:TIGR03620 family F420-dependent LLM class oxidoreductase [Caulobacteraceae bacterium]
MSTASAPATRAADSLGRVGIWTGEFRSAERAEVQKAAAELDGLGFGAIWVPGGVGGDILGDMDRLLTAAPRAVIATGIVNVWKHEPAEIGTWWRGLPPERQARVMLGLGISHGPLIGESYGRPIETMAAYLDKLDAEGVAVERRCLAALGPKMLDLSRERSAGAHPYLTTPEHTRVARQRLGPDALLAPEQGVILETDAGRARQIARGALGLYMRLPNYVNNWRRLGFSEADVTGPSDGLLDALFAWGGLDRIAERVEAHLAAGANHVCLQVIDAAPRGGADLGALRQAWRELAKIL